MVLSAFRVVITFLLIAYPFLISWLIKNNSITFTALALIFLMLTNLVIRFLSRDQQFSKSSNLSILKNLSVYSSIAGLLIAGLTIVSQQNEALYYYPIMVNMVFLSIFWASLKSEKSIIERFAVLTEKSLPAPAVSYCKVVTKIWCCFFVLNSLISLWTIFQDNLAYWEYYNGMISYILIGLLALVEYLYRILIFKPGQYYD